MKLITRCPSCNTLFRFVPDQLKLADGWVRCGKCNEKFEALSYLTEGQSRALLDALKVNETEANNHTTSNFNTEYPGRTTATTSSLKDNFVENSSEIINTSPTFPSFEWDVAFDAVANQEAALSTKAQPSHPNTPLGSNHPSESSSKKIKNWTYSLLWWLVFLIGIGMVVVALFTGAYYYRNSLVNGMPALRPALELLCKPMSCKIPAASDISVISLGASSLIKNEDGSLKLDFTLDNHADYQVRSPDISLKLMDDQGITIKRLLAHPKEYGFGSDALGAHAEVKLSFPLTMLTTDEIQRVQRYEIEVLYQDKGVKK